MPKLVEILYFSDPIDTDRLEKQIRDFLKDCEPNEKWQPGPFFIAPWVDERGDARSEFFQVLHRFEEDSK